MTPREAHHARVLGLHLDRVCLVSWQARQALTALLEAADYCVEGSQPWEIAEHEPGDVTVELNVGPAVLDPTGKVIP